jgi:hypothetical protein
VVELDRHWKTLKRKQVKATINHMQLLEREVMRELGQREGKLKADILCFHPSLSTPFCLPHPPLHWMPTLHFSWSGSSLWCWRGW